MSDASQSVWIIFFGWQRLERREPESRRLTLTFSGLFYFKTTTRSNREEKAQEALPLTQSKICFRLFFSLALRNLLPAFSAFPAPP
jgi:hypothetical protein